MTKTPTKKMMEREFRKFEHEIRTEFNELFKGIAKDERKPFKNELNQNLERLKEFIKSQPEKVDITSEP